jgi:hypothetical protein
MNFVIFTDKLLYGSQSKENKRTGDVWHAYGKREMFWWGNQNEKYKWKT